MSATNSVLPLKALESNRVRLVIFNPTEHIRLLFAAHQTPGPYLWRYCFFPESDIESQDALLNWYTKWVGSVPTSCLWAIFDVASGSFAGVTGLVGTSLETLSTELAFVTIIPAFQRTHVQTNATGLLMQFLFDELKFHRVQWSAHQENMASVNAATRMGFTLEGVKDSFNPVNRTDALGDEPGRDTLLLSMTWEMWESEGTKERVEVLMSRVV